ncbi:MAG: FG-GAP-like repeat-containing protein [Acidobacteriota bacterium]|nr:FG-GAP-like repeat-containing protein [Acidobacteriota bacterium]
MAVKLDKIAILLGNGNGGFTQPSGSPITGIVPTDFVAVGDFNLDGKSDLAATDGGNNGVAILLGDGRGAFSQAWGAPIGIGSSPLSVAVGDFNLDNKPDFATANGFFDTATVYLNTCPPQPPTINCSPNINVGNNAGQNSALVPFTVTVAGAPMPIVTCRVGNTVITSPHVFPVGTTTVTCMASNGVAPDASCSFTVTVNRVSGSANDPLACTGPGGKVQATLNVSNDGQVNQNVVSNTTFTNLTGLPGSCSVTPNVGTCTVTAAGVNYSATLTPGVTAAITYLTQVNDSVLPGAQVCTNNSVSFNGGTPLNFSACDVVDCPPIGPGGGLPAATEMSGQKAGSVLVYNVYTSSTDPTRQNTRLNITNTHSQLPAFVHLFFVAEGCSVADSYVCLTPNQTTSFLASDLDPGTTGYVVAVAVDARGCPINFNYLIGDEYVKFASGHAANLGAGAFAAIPGGLPACDGNSVTAALNFDGVSFNRVPAALALSNVGSRADGNDTLLIVNRIGGNLGIGAASLGTLFGVLYDDAENALSFSVTGGCQFRSSLTNNTPRTTPRFETFIPAGRTGWLKVFNQTGAIGMTGAAINFNANSASSAGAFNQGHNLHALTLNNQMSYVMPVFPPSC